MSFSKKLKGLAIDLWEEGYNHPFVQGIGQGTLDRKKFQFYLLQDYQYLIQYAKVFALAAVKSDKEEIMTKLTKIQNDILVNEMEVHREYMLGFGIKKEEILESKPSLFNRTYTANMLATGQTGDLVEILVAVLPCAWTYSDYAKRLKVQYEHNLEGNFYRTWIENYSSSDFEESFEWIYPVIDKMVMNKSEAQKKGIIDIFISSVEFEYLFWDMSYKQELSYHI